MTFKPTPATPAQIAAYGHVATRLRRFLAEKGWKPGDFNEAIGRKRSNTAIYTWLNAKASPGPQVAEQVARLMGLAPSELLSREIDVPPPSAVVRVSQTERQREILLFSARNDGTVQIHLNVTLPWEQALPLFRMLLDAGLIVSLTP